MAFEQLKSVITTQIKTNGIESITGAIMQSVLLQMVDELGEWTDTSESPYATQDWVSTQLLGYATTAALGAKQDQLVSGTNIKTINNQSILGSGNIDIQGGGGGDYLPISGGTLLGDLNIAAGYKLRVMYSEDLGMSKYNYWNSYLGYNNLKFTYLGYGEQSERTPLELVYRPVLNGYSILEVTGRVKSFGFSVPYGTSDQFLKADGSLDINQYLTLSGGIIHNSGQNKLYVLPAGLSATYSDVDNDVDYTTEVNALGIRFKETDLDDIRIYRNNYQIRFQLEESDYADIKAGRFIRENGDDTRVLLDGGGVKLLSDVAGTWSGMCSTPSSNASKTMVLAGFELIKNVTISVRFIYAINTPDATLNVNSTGAKPIKINGEALQYGVIHTGMTAIMQYDGTNWNIVSLMGLEKGGVGAHLVDLGLPTGLLWAASNIDISQADGFAVSPADAGSYFSWGNNEGHNPVNSSFVNVYDWGTGVDTAPYKDSIGAKVTANLSPQMDMARANLGAPWRLPSRADFQELYDNCTWTWGTLDGKNGYTVLATNGNSIFLPAAGLGDGTSLSNFGSHGYYWSSSFLSSTYAYHLFFYSGGIYPQYSYYRCNGFSVRAVQ